MERFAGVSLGSHDLPPNRIDVMTSISGVSFDEAKASRIFVKVADLELPVLERAALLKNKRATGRPKDILDAEALEQAVPRRP